MYILIEVFASAVVLIPIFLLLWKVKFHNFNRTVLYTIFAIYLSAVYHLVGLPTIQFLEFDVNLNLIPVVGMIEDLKNTALNVILFVPLGVMLPFLWKKYRAMKSTLLFGFGMTLTIELLQLLTFRATDINDIIANTLGTIIGYFIFAVMAKIFPAITNIAKKKNEVYFILSIVILVMFFVQPYITSFIYSVT